MKRTFISLAAGFAVLTLVMIAAENANGQRRRRTRGRTYTKAAVEKVIKRVEERTDNFVDNFDSSLDKSNLDGTRREDQLMRRAKDLESATDELRREFDRRDRWIDNKAEVRKCLNIASDIDRTMRNRRFGRKTESNWVRVRYELNTLAGIYRLPKVGSRSYR